MLRRFQTDICIAGAGIIGLSLALELHARGLSVVVLDAGAPMGEASTAAAGMLAAGDPHNPPELSALAHLSISLYEEFLGRITQRSGIAVPFQTSRTLQSMASHGEADAPLSSVLPESFVHASRVDDESSVPPGYKLLAERSIDPRQLAPALVAAVASSSIVLFKGEPLISTQAVNGRVAVSTVAHTIEAAHFIDCTGAWASDPAYNVVPIKGQMLAVALPLDFLLGITVRTRDIYVVPRTMGPSAGRATIGATVEDAGFDKAVHAGQIEALHRKAAALLPQLSNAVVLDSWAGLRPATPDRLPLLGPHPTKPRHWIASGHYRNGILLGPGTARVMTEVILGEAPSVSIAAFSPSRLMLDWRG